MALTYTYVHTYIHLLTSGLSLLSPESIPREHRGGESIFQPLRQLLLRRHGRVHPVGGSGRLQGDGEPDAHTGPGPGPGPGRGPATRYGYLRGGERGEGGAYAAYPLIALFRRRCLHTYIHTFIHTFIFMPLSSVQYIHVYSLSSTFFHLKKFQFV